MGTKSFFNKQKSQEVKLRGQEKSTIDDVKQNVESSNYIKEHSIDKFDFVPQLDFEDPANFVKYGSAKDYYVDLVDSVVQSYPYDGSLAERLNYRNGLVAIMDWLQYKNMNLIKIIQDQLDTLILLIVHIVTVLVTDLHLLV